MPERVELWWARRQFSRAREKPYEVGTYRAAWAKYPMLVKQYHPDLNAGIALSQVPPAADVWLQWQCEVGHIFVATPEEQRNRPGRERRRSVWCPDCAGAAAGRMPKPVARPNRPPRKRKPAKPTCDRTPALPVGTAFVSECAPAPASAVEADLRYRLIERLTFDATPNAVRIRRPFFDHLEVWPDIVIGELGIAIEFDSTGRHGLEHVGPREKTDARKDRALRAAGWEVVRIRTGRLEALGPFDLVASGVTTKLVNRLVDRLREARGGLLVDAYLK